MRVTPRAPAARLILPNVRKRWPFSSFFWKEVVNSSFTAPQRDSFANTLFNREQARPQRWLAWEGNGAQWEACGERPRLPAAEDPLPWVVPIKVISATPLLLVPQVQGSPRGRSPARAIACVRWMFLIRIKVEAAASVHQVSFGKSRGPPFFFFFPSLFFSPSFFLLLLSPAECH